MVRKERLIAVINKNITDELIADCKEELRKIEEKERIRRETMTPRQEANIPVEEEIVRVLEDAAGPMTIEEIGQAIEIEGLKRQRLTAVATNLRNKGIVESCDVKVKGKGVRKGYRLV